MKSNAIILSGGKGQRMGFQEKGLILYQGESLIRRKVRLLEDLFSEIIVVTNSPDLYQGLPDSVIVERDELPHRGPLHALHTGLRRSSAEVNFVTAVDMPFVNRDLIAHMSRFVRGHEAIVARVDGYIETLFGFYSKGLLPKMESLMDDPKSGLTTLIDVANSKILEESEVQSVDPKLVSFANVNSSEDVERYLS